MFDSICSLPLLSDLNCQAVHPTESVVAVGLVSGHVQTFRLPPVASDAGSENDETTASENGLGHVDTVWKTRRHQGSCRTLDYSTDGSVLYSAGTDSIVKVADTETGQVRSKIRTPLADRSSLEFEDPALLHVVSPQTFLLATDSAALHLYDIRTDTSLAARPSQTHRPHTDEYISSLTPLPASTESTSGFSKQWVTTGGTTLAVTDLRRGVLVQSESQEEELLSSTYVSGLAKRGSSRGEKVLVGAGNGVLTLWERGAWDDQDERIHVDRSGESLDVLTRLPEGVTARPTVAVGLGDGSIRLVEIGQNKVVATLRHDEMDRVAAISFEAGGRMVSGGGQILKVWEEKFAGATIVDADESEDETQDTAVSKRERDDSSDNDSDDSSSEEEKKDKKRKKKKRKGKKQNQTGHKNGVLSFKGLD
ncbi:WD40 domain-containing protein [Pseudovirgaria hyperparasitica]|uniref:WD repeat-containing protein JIP5 n=1 Tax=Pseudovirgaria hyperparasitica TaxID=470096 RepID=A0A6A6VWL2_9PEZI|nr:WD40 domain-containing protein [Pseudovirgaria hyperparasitica]KAF2754982.1 WD40 domain-containing protein [Pseudovirgaria hyperparasitica]